MRSPLKPQAGRLVWGGRRVCRGLHVIAYLSITLPCFVCLCGLLQIPDLRYLLISALTPPTIRWISTGCGKHLSVGRYWVVSIRLVPMVTSKTTLPFVLQAPQL